MVVLTVMAKLTTSLDNIHMQKSLFNKINIHKSKIKYFKQNSKRLYGYFVSQSIDLLIPS